MASHEVKMVQQGFRYSYLGWYNQGTPNSVVNEYVADPIKEPELAKKATNVYMTSIRDDFKKYLIDCGYEQSSDQFYITNSNY